MIKYLVTNIEEELLKYFKKRNIKIVQINYVSEANKYNMSVYIFRKNLSEKITLIIPNKYIEQVFNITRKIFLEIYSKNLLTFFISKNVTIDDFHCLSITNFGITARLLYKICKISSDPTTLIFYFKFPENISILQKNKKFFLELINNARVNNTDKNIVEKMIEHITPILNSEERLLFEID